MEAIVKSKHIEKIQSTEAENWDLVIEPNGNLFSLNLSEVWRYRDLLFLFVKRDFVAQYKQTILGPLWHLVQPIFITVVFLITFGKIAALPTDGIEPVLFYMSGITLWNYFSACLTATSNTFVANAGIFGKVYFPRLVMPLSIVISNIIRLWIQALLLLATMIFYAIKGKGFHIGGSWMLIPLVVLMIGAFGLGTGIVVSSLTTKYRDFSVVIGFAVQLVMFITPIAYPMSFLKSKSFASWIAWNPLSPIMEAFRYALFGKGTLDTNGLLYSGSAIVIILLVGLLLFSRVERTFMDTV